MSSVFSDLVLLSPFLLSVLLESLNKSEPSSTGQSQARESPNAQFRKAGGDFPSANGEAGGEAPKGYTQDQVDAVKRCVCCLHPVFIM